MPDFWKYFPAIYVLPFIFATTRFEALSSVSENARWAVMVFWVVFAIQNGFSRGTSKIKVPLTGFDIVAICVLVSFAASYFWSVDPNYSLFRAGSMLLLYLVTFWALWWYTDIYTEAYLLKIITRTCGMILAANIMIGSLILPGELIAGRFRGVFENPNNIGMIGALILPLLCIQWLRKRQKLDLFLLLAVALNIAAAGSRTSMLAVAIASGGLLFTLTKRKPNLAWGIIIIGLACILGFSQTEYFKEYVLRSGSIESASGRVEFWNHAKSFIANKPLLGHGFGTDGIIWRYYGLDMRTFQLRGYGVMSSYYGLAVCMGKWFAWIFFGAFWLWLISGIIQSRKRLLELGYLFIIMGGLVVSIFETTLYSAGNCFSFLFWIVVMLLVRRKTYRSLGIRLSAPGKFQKASKRKKTMKQQPQRRRPVAIH